VYDIINLSGLTYRKNLELMQEVPEANLLIKEGTPPKISCPVTPC
jgi:hypothetical protein